MRSLVTVVRGVVVEMVGGLGDLKDFVFLIGTVKSNWKAPTLTEGRL
jgi:hypothetical protein